MFGLEKGARIFMGCELLQPGRGGICRVARMSAQALVDAGYQLSAQTLLDDAPQQVAGVRASTTRGSRIRFGLGVQAAKLTHQAFLYDTVGTARAHGMGTRGLRPYTAWVHGREIWYRLHPAREAALKGAAQVVANSAFCLRRFAELHWEIEGAKICSLATEDDTPPERLAHFEGRPRVLILGTMETGYLYKGHQELIAAWPQVLRALPEAELVIAGGGSGRAELEAAAKASGAGDAIRFLGFVKDEDLPALWADAWVMAMPSSNEGFGLVYVEAMRCGVPAIASTEDAGQEVNRHGETGFNLDKSDISGLADHLIELLSDPDKTAAMGQAGHQLWQDRYRYSAFKDRFLSLW